MDAHKQISLLESIELYADRRLWVIFLLGFSSGFPWVLTGSAMTAWLQETGLSRSSIGLFGLIASAYFANFLWSPFLDRVRLPLTRRLGQRKSWIILMQGLILLGTLAISQTGPGISIILTAAFALSIAIASATQDIAVDAYRIEIIGAHEEEKIPAGSAMATSGWWTGYSLPGAVAFWLSDPAYGGWSWGEVYTALSLILVLLMVVVLFIKEPASNREAEQQQREQHYLHLLGDHHTAWERFLAWFAVTLIEPLREFFTRNGVKLALAILSFIFLFKIGEAFLGRMSIVFYKEIGFSNADIGTYSKFIGWWVTIIFAVTGSLFNARFGIVRGLMIGGIAMACSNLMFAWIAATGPDKTLLLATIIIDNFTTAFSTVTFVAFISYLTHRTYTATQYALMASLGNLGRTTLSSASGALVDYLNGNWTLFFIITALMVIPSLILLLRIGKYIDR